MNKNLKELEKQCWTHRVDGTLVDGQLHFDTKKFAELIVAEMLQTCEDHPAWTGRMISEEIRQRFGVE